MNVDDHLAQQMQDPEFRREWEAHEDCFEEQKRLTRYIIRYRRLRDGYKAQRDEARELARNYRRVLLENYGDMATQALFAEDDCYYEWLRDDDNGPQEVVMTTNPNETPKEIRCVVYRVIHESNGDSSIVIGEADVRRPHLASSVEIRLAEGHSFRPGQMLRVTIEGL